MSFQGIDYKQLSKNVQKHRRILVLVISLLIGSLIIAACGMIAYNNYQNELLKTEQNQLLTMARTIGQSLTNYMGLECEDIQFFCELLQNENEENLDYALEQFAMRNNGLYNWIALYDGDEVLISQWGQTPNLPIEFPQEELPSAKVLGKAIEQTGGYALYVAQSVRIDSRPCYLIGAIDLNHIYEVTVRPVKIGSGGYSVVKDRQLSIIMHHAKSQIGMDAVYDRSIQYPQLDLTDLTEWVDMQRTADSGTSVIRSYIWDSPELTPQKRIVAYTTINVLGDEWIVNSTLPYEELEVPLWSMMQKLIAMSTGMMIMLLAFGLFLNRYLHRMESQRKEIKYLRRINAGMELLRKKEDEIRHYQRVQSLGEMSSQIAHEFNNYLTPIMLYGEILEGDETLSEENKEFAHEILKAAERGAALSRRLLNFSRQDTGLQLNALCLTDEVRKAADMVSQLAPKKVDFQYTVPSTPVYYMGREGEMEQILMNICGNAFHAMEETEIRKLCISLNPCTPEQLKKLPPSHMGWAALQITDTGSGIPEEVLSKIFDPFFTTKHKGKGTGLGLSVVKNAVTTSGGQIEVQSKLGEGTTFLLLLPLCEEGQLPGGNRQIDSVGKIAVVDDEIAILRAAETDLKRKGHKVDCFANPMEILSEVQGDPGKYSLILLDVDMPEMDGLEAASLLRTLTRDIVIVMMSGRASPEAQRLLQNGTIDRFIPKAELSAFLDTIQ